MAKDREQVLTEALTAIRKFMRSGAAISMGVGKTKLGLDHCQLVHNKAERLNTGPATALIVAPTKKILQGWKDEAKKWKVEHLLVGMDFTTYRSLHKQHHKYDVIYLDECHSLIYNSHNNWLKEYKGIIIGLTGTPPKWPTSEKARMIKAYCPMQYEYLVDEAVTDNILNDYKITVHMLDLSAKKTHKVEIKDKKGNVTKSWYTSEVAHYKYWTDKLYDSHSPKDRQFNSIMRMSAMKTYATKDEYGKRLLDQAKEKCILFANEQKQADKLCKHSYHSNNKDSERNMGWFEDGTINKLSCVLQLSEGANIKGLKECIILHAYGNNKKTAQRIGRMLRLNPDDMAHIDILCFKDTQDVKWIKEALAGFDQSKISWYDPTIF